MSLPEPTPARAAVVTGASSGIGRELARQLARRGHPLVPVARRAEALAALADELGADARVTPLVADLTTATGREALAGVLRDAAVLVNCAGVGPVAPVSVGRRHDELACVELNAAATVDLCSRAVAGMVEHGSGAVLNVASTAAFMAVPGQAVYSASKAFVLSYTLALREELAGSGITVTALCPGPVRTGFARANGTDDERLFAGLPEQLILPAERVARAGLDGLDRDRGVVVPGRLNALMAEVTRHLPRRILGPLLAATAPGMAAPRD